MKSAPPDPLSRAVTDIDLYMCVNLFLSACLGMIDGQSLPAIGRSKAIVGGNKSSDRKGEVHTFIMR